MSTAPENGLLDRVAAGPISWGVCEVPGWGLQLEPDRVLAEMHRLGIRATEAGPDGWLGSDPRAVRRLLETHELRLVGGFLGIVLHDPRELETSLAHVRRTARLFAESGGEILCSAVVVDEDWSPRFELTEAQWKHVADGLELVDTAAAEEGIRHVLHPHWGTLVEQDADVRRILEISDVGLCLDTGHLTLGRCDPVELARSHPERIGHVHLKDVDAEVANRLRDGDLEFVAAVQQGLFRPLGDGDVDVRSTLTELEDSGYAGWYVLEQDVALSDAPQPGSGPLRDVRRSIDFLGGGREVTGDDDARAEDPPKQPIPQPR
jgi:inosose dehydratase